MESDPEYRANKIVLIGNVGVGKTTIFTRFKTGKAEGGDLNTRKKCEHTKTLTVDGKDTEITLYDTAGMERFEGTIPPTYFRSARAVIFVYSITNTDSISDIASWTDSVSPQRLEYVGVMGELVRVLVGNKVDLEAEREVQTDRGLDTAENYEIEKHLVFEMSALEGTGFDQVFEAIIREIRKTSDNTQATLSLPPRKSGSGCGCMK